MNCRHLQMTKQQYNQRICSFKNRSDLFFFLLNTFLSIIYSGYLYCQCSRRECNICSIRTDFCNFQDEIVDNMYNIEFLKKYLTKLYPYWFTPFYLQKSSICCFLESEFSYTIRSWSGQIKCILLPDIIKKYEENILREEIRGPLLIPHAEENS